MSEKFRFLSRTNFYQCYLLSFDASHVLAKKILNIGDLILNAQNLCSSIPVGSLESVTLSIVLSTRKLELESTLVGCRIFPCPFFAHIIFEEKKRYDLCLN